MEKEFYTVKELAELVSVVPMTIYRLVDRGEIHVHNIGGSKRFRRNDVEEYLLRVRTIGKRELGAVKNNTTPDAP